MSAEYMFACAIVWQKTADDEAGWELIHGLESDDPEVRMFSHMFLVRGGERAMSLLEDALREGVVAPDSAAPCMAEILSIGGKRTMPSPTGDS